MVNNTDSYIYFCRYVKYIKKQPQNKLSLLPAGSSLLLAGSERRSHVTQHILIISGSDTRYDGMADLVTDGTLRRPRGCLLTGHTRYTRNTVILCFRFGQSDQTPLICD